MVNTSDIESRKEEAFSLQQMNLNLCTAFVGTWVQYIAPMSGSSQLPVIPALGGANTSGLYEYPHSLSYIHTQIDMHMHILFFYIHILK